MEKNLDTIMTTARYMTAQIFRNDLNTGHTDFLEMAYTHLKQQGNKRLPEKTKYMKTGNGIHNSFYESISDIILDEIFCYGNLEILSLFMNHQICRFPSIIEDAKKYTTDAKSFTEYINNEPEKSCSTEKCSRLLYHLLCLKNEGNKKAIVEYYRNELPFSERNPDCSYTMSQLSRELGVEDLRSNRSYQKFLSDQRKILTDYLRIKYGQLERFLLNPVAWNYGGGFSNAKQIILVLCSLDNVLTKYKISPDPAAGQSEKKYSAMINWNFENLCALRLWDTYLHLQADGQQPTLEKLLSKVTINNPKTFIAELLYSFQYDLLAERFKKSMEESHMGFSSKNLSATVREQELASENVSLQSEIDSLKDKLKQQEISHREASQKKLKEERHKYEEQIRYLEKKLEKEKNSNRHIEKEPEEETSSSCQRKTSVGKAGISEEGSERKNKEPADISSLSDMKILFLGGGPNMVKKLKRKFPHSSFVTGKSSSFPDKIDMTVVLAEHISHSLVKKYESLNYGAKMVESHSTNVDMILNDILQAV